MSVILIKDFPFKLNGRWGSFSDCMIIHGDGSVTDLKGHNFGNAKAIEVVRCENCERCEHNAVFEQAFGQYWCRLKMLVKPDGFCDLGKRREE